MAADGEMKGARQRDILKLQVLTIEEVLAGGKPGVPRHVAPAYQRWGVMGEHGEQIGQERGGVLPVSARRHEGRGR